MTSPIDSVNADETSNGEPIRTVEGLPAPQKVLAGPFLRTLVPALRQIEAKLSEWLRAVHRFPLATMTRAALQGLKSDLDRQAGSLDVDRPHLVIVLMGGTGVGKSTLLNALAGGSIAQASFARPTTRDPVVYYHESIKPDRLDPALRHCRLVEHDRPALEQKILVDTPDLDSNDLANREKLKQLLPIADIVLYVGSQEKYHDKVGWELFLQQRRRRAFAFVLNKWDRCLHAGTTGLRPDQDLIRDLQEEGFQDPLLFRTCAQFWVEQSNSSTPGTAAHPGPAAEGEQFLELVRWLEEGLTRLEIEAIKARGVSQLLHHLEETLRSARPPDLKEVAERTRSIWARLLADEAEGAARILLNTLEPYQKEVEHHFALENQRRFRGLMSTYLNLFTRAKYVGSSLRDRIPLMPKTSQSIETSASWDLIKFSRSCTNVAGERHLDARVHALANGLLVEADKQGYPVHLLADLTEETAKMDWRQRYAQTLIEVLQDVEDQWSRPTGFRRVLQGVVVWLANRLPVAALFGICVLLLWQYTVERRPFATSDFLLPFIVVFIVMVLLHILIALVLPLRWPSMRGEFQRHLERRLQIELQNAFGPLPSEVAQALQLERQQVERLLSETHDVSHWLEEREQAARVEGLYGK